MIRSAAAGNEEVIASVERQMIFAGMAMAVIIVMTLIDYRTWSSLNRLIYLVAVGLLVVIYVLGQARFGAQRWLEFGLILVQPTEVAKIAIILVLANYFSKRQHVPKDIRWILGSFLLTLGVVIWILLQPNLSNSIVIFVIWFAMLWLAGLPWQYLLVFGGIGLVGALSAFPFLEPYQQQRILTFFYPDPNARYGNSYNVDQALIAIGSGGLFGQGYGHGTQVQLRFLKVRHTDYIFSAMAEEFGFVGTVLVIALLVFVVIRCIRAARLAPDLFGAMISYGFAVLIFFQSAVNIGVNLKVIPVTGLTLPFISYGGSSLVSLALGIGLVESVISRRKTLDS
jgi:rod shape determining protein RodA